MTSKISCTDSSNCFEDVESDDLSLGTSIASDHTLSADDSERKTREKKKRIVKQLTQRKQLLHESQLLRVELQQKNVVIGGLKSEHAQHIEDLEERLNDVTYKKQIVQARLQAELLQGQDEQDETKKRQETISKEVELLKTKQQQLEAANERLLEKAAQVRLCLRDLSLSPQRYYQLKGLPAEDLSLRDYIAMRVYDTVNTLQTELDHLRTAGRAQDEQIAASAGELRQLKERLEEEHATNAELRLELQEASRRCSQEVVADGRRVEPRAPQVSSMEGDLDRLKKERDQLAMQLSSAQQAEGLLKQDKNYLGRQVAEVSRRADQAEDRLQQLTRQLDHARQTREEVYEKYVTCRDQYKGDYEKKLEEELDKIRDSTAAEMDQLRTSTSDMYERENRNLREARDTALAERERLQAAAREMATKCEELTTQLREVQSGAEREVSGLQNEAMVKGLQAQRSHMVCEETASHLKDKTVEGQLLQKKVELLQKEYYSLQTVTEKRVAELESQLWERTRQVGRYERMEGQLDRALVQAATGDHSAEKTLPSCGDTYSPCSAKPRLQQSVQLARQVLELERANSSLHRAIGQERDKVRQLTDELEKSRAMLDQMQQPQCDLLVSIRERDEHVRQMRGHIHSLQQELRQTEEERKRLEETQHKMSRDLQGLQHHTKGMAMMKRAVTALTARQRGQLQQPDGMEGEGEGGGEAGVRTQSVVRSTPSLSPSTLTRRTAPPGPYQPQGRQALRKKTTRKKGVQIQRRGTCKPLDHLKGWQHLG